MKRYPEHLVKQARRLIANGYSGSEVASKLGVFNSQVSVWCRDVQKSKFLGLVKYNQSKREELLRSEVNVLKNGFDKDIFKLLCGLLYGCEGAKYPASNVVSFVNSDPKLVVAFVNLLRVSYELDETKWHAHLQIHDDQKFEILRKYWSEILDIPEDKFFRPTVTHPRGMKHRNNYLGTCSVRYGDYRLQLKLIGIFNEFLGKYGSGGRVGRTVMQWLAKP